MTKQTIIFLLGLLVLPVVYGQESEKYYEVTLNYSDAQFKVINVALKPVEILPAPYPEGNYAIKLRLPDDSIAYSQTFDLTTGYFSDAYDEEEGLKGSFHEAAFTILKFYLPYNEKAKDIVLIDDKGKTRNVIDVTSFSTLTPEEKAAIKQVKEKTEQTARIREILIPLALMILILLAGVYWWRKQK